MVSFLADAAHAGTPEAEWRPYLCAAALAPLTMPLAPRAIVVAPHPDDEVLAVGGMLRHLHRRGTELVVAAVTDGEGSHPGEPASAVRSTRRREVVAAYAALGIAPLRHACGIADGAVTAHEAELVVDLSRLVRAGDLVVAPWPHDGHPDHDSAGRAAARAAADAGAAILTYPVWAWHWARPGAGDLPLRQAFIHPLTCADQAAKAKATAAFTSQLTRRSGPDRDPVLGPSVLARFSRPFEVLFGS